MSLLLRGSCSWTPAAAPEQSPQSVTCVLIAGIAQDHEPTASALMAETILLASASASRILLRLQWNPKNVT